MVARGVRPQDLLDGRGDSAVAGRRGGAPRELSMPPPGSLRYHPGAVSLYYPGMCPLMVPARAGEQARAKPTSDRRFVQATRPADRKPLWSASNRVQIGVGRCPCPSFFGTSPSPSYNLPREQALQLGQPQTEGGFSHLPPRTSRPPLDPVSPHWAPLRKFRGMPQDLACPTSAWSSKAGRAGVACLPRALMTSVTVRGLPVQDCRHADCSRCRHNEEAAPTTTFHRALLSSISADDGRGHAACDLSSI
jgi:hypothetical protein